MWWIFALLAAFFAALTAILAKIGLKDINPDLATAIRTVVILVLSWGIVFFKGGTKAIFLVSKRGLLFLVLSGLAAGFSWLFYFRALQAGKVSQVASVDKLSLALVIIFSILCLGETITWKILTGAILIIAGTLLLIL
ncbi:MAG TPA: EamA family transporter [Edaphocola sp.]|nr:EamA family transporter [Edaphocola sp.]